MIGHGIRSDPVFKVGPQLAVTGQLEHEIHAAPFQDPGRFQDHLVILDRFETRYAENSGWMVTARCPDREIT